MDHRSKHISICMHNHKRNAKEDLIKGQKKELNKTTNTRPGSIKRSRTESCITAYLAGFVYNREGGYFGQNPPTQLWTHPPHF